ncbi:MAG: lasso peptide biosynthesis B2 protein [Chloroflexi bacterium]|nr:lasso peptide biosynthesis B2 protein [Chloroflexota bacterium]
MTRRLRKFLRLPRADKLRLINSAILLLLIRLGLKLMPLRALRRLLSRVGRVREQGSAPTEEAVFRTVWAVNAAGRRVPWASTCLTRALAAQVMLGRIGESSDLHIGVTKDEGGALQAHAWLEGRGGVIIGGEESLLDFTRLPDVESRSS